MKRQNTKTLDEVLALLIKENGLEEGLLIVRVFDAWDLIMVEQTAPFVGSSQEAKDLTTSKFFKNGVLTCRINSSVVRMQLSFQIPALIKKLNSLLQGEFVFKIVLL